MEEVVQLNDAVILMKSLAMQYPCLQLNLYLYITGKRGNIMQYKFHSLEGVTYANGFES